MTALEQANQTMWQIEKHDAWKKARKAGRAARTAWEALSVDATNATLAAILDKTDESIARAAAAVEALEQAARTMARCGEAETLALREWASAYQCHLSR